MAFLRPSAALAISALLAACTGEVTDGEVCIALQDNVRPETPTLTMPTTTGLVASRDLVLVGSPFADADDDDEHAASEFEIWSFRDGAPVGKVWTADVAAPSPLTSVIIDDGRFAGGPTVTGLAEWQEHGARVRYRDSSLRCSGWSEWSDFRQFRSDDASAYLFDDTRIHDVYLEIPPASWQAIHDEAVPPGCEPHQRSYYPGTVRFEDQVFEGAGVRAKGGCGSARDLTSKAAFKVNLAWDDPTVDGCPAERRLYAEQRLTLNNMTQDPSFVHERLAYALHRAMGVPTPRAAHIRVFVNDELWGLYLHQETVDRRFLRRWFPNHDGMMYEGTYWCDLIGENLPDGLDDTGCLSRKFTPDACSTPAPEADPTDYTLLRQLVASIDALPEGGFYPEIEEFFDFDMLLTSWAVNAVIANWDSYEYEIINNYRVYHDPSTDRWTLIPTGFDQTFGQDHDPWEVYGRLARRCLSEPDCEAVFATRLHAVLDKLAELDLATRAQTIQDQIADFVAEDPRRDGSYDQFVNQARATREWIGARPQVVRDILAAHGY